MTSTAQYDRRAVWSWALYDFANSPFTTLVVTFIYATFFTQVIASDPNGDFVRIDHLATGLLPPVPSLSAPLLLVLVALLSLVAALRLRHQTH